MDPIAMLFDEPTSALDPEMVGEVLDCMMGWPTRHDHDGDIRWALPKKHGSRVIFMDVGGKILEDC
jgi:glutamate/aspartate transport system ATP-binding protein